jgi:hypothetical protein
MQTQVFKITVKGFDSVFDTVYLATDFRVRVRVNNALTHEIDRQAGFPVCTFVEESRKEACLID